ncbi:MAG TPA: FtsX-like permease family protein [Thermopetrobacter sp.]|nr:FtsX-like permease family protein [Thermopetrobacter sp.]
MRRWLARQLHLADFTLGALKRRRGRNLMLLAVYTLVIFILASLLFFGAALRREATATLAGAPEVTVQNLVMGRHALAPPEWVEKLAGIRGTRHVQGRLWGYFYDQAVGANYTVMVPPAQAKELRVAPGETIIGAGIARLRDVARTGYLFLLSPAGKLFKLRVRRVLPGGSELLSADLVLMSAADFRRFFGLAPADGYTDIALSVRNPNEIATVVAKIGRALPGARVITREDILRTYENVFSWREGIVLAMLSAALVAFAIFAFDKASGLSAEERREIGILKAVGWETADIIAMKLWEGGLISLFAFVFGVAAAYAHVFLFDAGVLAPVLKGWSVLYPRFPLVPTVDRLQLITLAFVTVAPFIAATLVPVWKAAITDPDVVMR